MWIELRLLTKRKRLDGFRRKGSIACESPLPWQPPPIEADAKESIAVNKQTKNRSKSIEWGKGRARKTKSESGAIEMQNKKRRRSREIKKKTKKLGNLRTAPTCQPLQRRVLVFVGTGRRIFRLSFQGMGGGGGGVF